MVSGESCLCTKVAAGATRRGGRRHKRVHRRRMSARVAEIVFSAAELGQAMIVRRPSSSPTRATRWLVIAFTWIDTRCRLRSLARRARSLRRWSCRRRADQELEAACLEERAQRRRVERDLFSVSCATWRQDRSAVAGVEDDAADGEREGRAVALHLAGERAARRRADREPHDRRGIVAGGWSTGTGAATRSGKRTARSAGARADRPRHGRSRRGVRPNRIEVIATASFSIWRLKAR